jgi:hypothetical protein
VNRQPQSWAASILGFALAVLAACLALKLAAEFLLAALPVLVPAVIVTTGVVALGRWWWNRPTGW